MGELPARADLLGGGEARRRRRGDHPLLRLGDDDLPGLELLSQRHAVEPDVDAEPVARHFRQRRGEARRAAVLQRGDEAALDELERRLDQLVAGERVADLHRRTLVGIVLAELLARENAGAADSVAPGRRAEEQHEVARARGRRAGETLGGEEADAHRVHEAVVRVGRVEGGRAAHGWDADRVPVAADALDRPLEVVVGRAEEEAVEQRDRAGAHGHDVAEDAADAGGGALKRLDRARVVVALDLERDRLAVAEVEHAGVLAGALEDAGAGRRQAREQACRVLVRAVLRPEEGEDGELERIRVPAEQVADALEFPVREAECPVERLFRDGRQRGGSSREG